MEKLLEVLKKRSAVVVLGIAAGALSCARDLSPQAGAGGAAGSPDETGGLSGTGGSNCTFGEVHRFAACWDRDLGYPGASNESSMGGGYLLRGLSLIRSVEPDVSYCLQGFPYTIGPASNFTEATAPFVAWQFENEMGEPIVIQFAVEGATNDLVSPGDEIDLRVTGFLDLHGMPHAGALIERAGVAVIGFHLDGLTEFGEAFGLEIGSAHAMCAEEEGVYCSVARAIQVTGIEESKIIPVGESATVEGLTIFNAHYFDNRDCDEVYPDRDWSLVEAPESEIGLYTSRGE